MKVIISIGDKYCWIDDKTERLGWGAEEMEYLENNKARGGEVLFVGVGKEGQRLEIYNGERDGRQVLCVRAFDPIVGYTTDNILKRGDIGKTLAQIKKLGMNL